MSWLSGRCSRTGLVALWSLSCVLPIGAMPITGSAVVRIADLPAPTPAAGLAQVPQSQLGAGDLELDEVTVEEQRRRYLRKEATTGTRTDTPLRDIPQSIQVIPRQLIEDQQAVRVDEALRNVSGVVAGGIDTSTDVRFAVRGFDRVPILQDGFRQYNYAEVPEIANLERIEVLKGPASVLYGEIQPGGVINTIVKKPLATPLYAVDLQVGSFGFVRPRVDLAGPLTADKTVRYRLNALFERSDGFRNFTQPFERVFVAPIVSWAIGERTDLSVELQYLDRRRPSDTGTSAFGKGILRIPRERILDEPDDYIARTFLNVGYNLEHRFSDNWTLRNGFRYTTNSVFSDKLTIPLALDESTGILSRVYAFDDFDSIDYSLQTNLTGKFATGSLAHTLLLGLDWNRGNSSGFARSDFSTLAPINVFDPVYGAVPRSPLNLVILDRRTESERTGVYVQDQITLVDNVKLLAGLRYETIQLRTRDQPVVFTPLGADITQNNDAFTPRLGLVYQPFQALSLYSSYSRSFTPSVDTFTIGGNPLPPERGEGYEFGAKAELLGDRLFATLSYFDIAKRNVASSDPRFPGLGFSVATGEQRSRGVEFDLTGQLLPGWNIIASYAYIDAAVTQDNITPVGNRLPGIPEHSASFWTRYEIPDGQMQGLGFGLGFNYVGQRQGDLDNSFELGTYFLTNAAVSYRRDAWKLAININNLFDVDYFVGIPFGRVGSVGVGTPLTVIGSLSTTF